jgi:hypothetical protein
VLPRGFSNRRYQWQEKNRWGVPERRLWGRSTFFWGWGDELEAEGDVFGKWGGFGESEVVHSPFKAKRVRG